MAHAHKALNKANTECLARFNEARSDQFGQGQRRVVSVGVMTGLNKQFRGPIQAEAAPFETVSELSIFAGIGQGGIPQGGHMSQPLLEIGHEVPGFGVFGTHLLLQRRPGDDLGLMVSRMIERIYALGQPGVDVELKAFPGHGEHFHYFGRQRRAPGHPVPCVLCELDIWPFGTRALRGVPGPTYVCFLDKGHFLARIKGRLRSGSRPGYGHVEVGEGADLVAEVVVVCRPGLPVHPQIGHQPPQRGGEHDDAIGVVVLLAHHLGAYPHHEQPGLLPVGPEVGDPAIVSLDGVGVEDVGQVAVGPDPLGGIRPGVADGESYPAEVLHQV